MQKIRENCFWHNSFKDMAATIHQCEIAEPWTCPCTEDCEWFITKAAAKELMLYIQESFIKTNR